jgi:hypothetical protein
MVSHDTISLQTIFSCFTYSCIQTFVWYLSESNKKNGGFEYPTTHSTSVSYIMESTPPSNINFFYHTTLKPNVFKNETFEYKSSILYAQLQWLISQVNRTIWMAQLLLQLTTVFGGFELCPLRLKGQTLATELTSHWQYQYLHI